MSTLAENSTDRRKLIDALPGWLCLIGGLALLAMVVLVPAHLTNQRTHWRLALMREQSQRLDQKMVRYEQFDDALAGHDPTVLKRLAFAELRLKPVGRELVGNGSTLLLGTQVRRITDFPMTGNSLAAPRPGSVPDWLDVTQPVVGLDYPRPPKIKSLLTNLSAGPLRWLGLVGGLTVSLIGLLFTPGSFGGEAERRAGH